MTTREIKIRVPSSLYSRLRHVDDTYSPPGGISGIVRRAFRWWDRTRVACCEFSEPATRDDSTVLTVFLPPEAALLIEEMPASFRLGIISSFLDLPRPSVQPLSSQARHDINYLRKSEKDLAERTRRLRSLFESANILQECPV